MSFTYKPKKKKRAKSHGFLARSKSAYGKRVIQKRRQKGRKRLTTV
ncbi:MAG: 50S ribosomal protein L34 [Candidatus Paceibacterota bacterium]